MGLSNSKKPPIHYGFIGNQPPKPFMYHRQPWQADLTSRLREGFAKQLISGWRRLGTSYHGYMGIFQFRQKSPVSISKPAINGGNWYGGLSNRGTANLFVYYNNLGSYKGWFGGTPILRDTQLKQKFGKSLDIYYQCEARQFVGRLVMVVDNVKWLMIMIDND